MNELEKLREYLHLVANGFVGEKELPNNGGFVNPWMTQVMTACGFVKGYSWCMITVEAIYRLAIGKLRRDNGKLYQSLWDEATGKINPSTQLTYNNFVKGAKHFATLSVRQARYTDLNVGDIVIFVQPKNTGFGHAGVVVAVYADSFLSVEGNTNSNGSANGDGVYLKTRTIEANGQGLDVRGFIQLVSVE